MMNILVEKDFYMPKQRKTSSKAAKSASKVLKSKTSSKHAKIAAGSALSQAAPKQSGGKKKK